jgi:hypothetical protein
MFGHLARAVIIAALQQFLFDRGKLRLRAFRSAGEQRPVLACGLIDPMQ